MDAQLSVPVPRNEPVRGYAPGSAERTSLQARLDAMRDDRLDLTMTIDGEQRMAGGETIEVAQPHRRHDVLGVLGNATRADAEAAVAAAKNAAPAWRALPYSERAAVFLRAAELLAGSWRDTLNAATILGQSKSAYQAEIDAACELIDFLRFNVAYGQQILGEQPQSATTGRWRASSTPSRRSTSPRSRPTCRRRPRSWATPSSGSRRPLSSWPRSTRCGCSRRPVCRRASSTW